MKTGWVVLAGLAAAMLMTVGPASADGMDEPVRKRVETRKTRIDTVRKTRVEVRIRRTDAIATPELVRKAHLGDPRAQAYLGFMYEHGRGLPQDYKLAAQWYHLAAQAGDSRGQHWLGMLYDKGFGVPESYIQAHKWLNLAAAGASDADRDYFIRMRNAIATKISHRDTVEAQRRARTWTDFHARWLDVD